MRRCAVAHCFSGHENAFRKVLAESVTKVW
jgi:hypothetical protein